MRVRLVLVLAIVVVLFVATATFLALWHGGPGGRGSAGVLTTTYTDVRVGSAKAIAFEAPGKDHHEERVFLVRTTPTTVQAFRGVSTHLGCALMLPGDARYGSGFTETSTRAYFEDPCGGSVYSLDGDCTGGPCPRDLDRYAIEVRDDHVDIDTHDLTRGPPRGS
jgi:Rieske Fe-S protein